MIRIRTIGGIRFKEIQENRVSIQDRVQERVLGKLREKEDDQNKGINGGIRFKEMVYECRARIYDRVYEKA